MGYGYEEMAALNPRLVYVSVAFAGQTGPLRIEPGHDPAALALAGALGRLNGTATPTLPGAQVADVLAGTHATIAALAALQARERTGRGQHVDVAMTDAAMPLLMVALGRAATPADVPPTQGSLAIQKAACGNAAMAAGSAPPTWSRPIGRGSARRWESPNSNRCAHSLRNGRVSNASLSPCSTPARATNGSNCSMRPRTPSASRSVTRRGTRSSACDRARHGCRDGWPAPDRYAVPSIGDTRQCNQSRCRMPPMRSLPNIDANRAELEAAGAFSAERA